MKKPYKRKYYTAKIQYSNLEIYFVLEYNKFIQISHNFR